MKMGMRARQEVAVWESITGSWSGSWTGSWRTYFCFVLVGAIFILCQAFSGGIPGNRAGDNSPDLGDRSYRDALRIETSGRGGRAWAGKIPGETPGRDTETAAARLRTD
jgi:hypothetical protein